MTIVCSSSMYFNDFIDLASVFVTLTSCLVIISAIIFCIKTHELSSISAPSCPRPLYCPRVWAGGGSCRQCHVSGVRGPAHWLGLPDGCGAI